MMLIPIRGEILLLQNWQGCILDFADRLAGLIVNEVDLRQPHEHWFAVAPFVLRIGFLRIWIFK